VSSLLFAASAGGASLCSPVVLPSLLRSLAVCSSFTSDASSFLEEADSVVAPTFSPTVKSVWLAKAFQFS